MSLTGDNNYYKQNLTNTIPISEDLLILSQQVNDNTNDIHTNEINIAANTSSINTLNTQVAANTTNISANTSSINTLNTQVSANTTNIATNTSSINTLNTQVATNTTNIATNTTKLTGMSYSDNTTNFNNKLTAFYDRSPGNSTPHFRITNTSTTPANNRTFHIHVGASSGGYSGLIKTGDVAMITSTQNVADCGTGFALVGHCDDGDHGLRISTNDGLSELHCGTFDLNCVTDCKNNILQNISNLKNVAQITYNDGSIQTSAFTDEYKTLSQHISYADVANSITFDTKLWCQIDLFCVTTNYGTISLVGDHIKILANEVNISNNANNIVANTNEINAIKAVNTTQNTTLNNHANDIASIKVKTDPLTYGNDGVNTSIQSAHFIATSLAVRNAANTIHDNITHNDTLGAMFFETRSNVTGTKAFSFSSYKTGDTITYFDINHNNVDFHGKDALNVGDLSANTLSSPIITGTTITGNTQVITPKLSLNNRALTTMSNVARCTIQVDNYGVYYLSKNLGFRQYNSGKYVIKLGTGRITLQLADFTNITSSGYQVVANGSWNGNHDGGDALCVNVNQKSAINQDFILGHEFRLSLTRTYNTGSLCDLTNQSGLYGHCDVIVMY